MKTFEILVELADGAKSPFVAINRKPVSLVPNGEKFSGTITVDDGSGPDNSHLLTMSFIGDIGAKCRIKITNEAGDSIVTNWITINANTVPFGANHRKFVL